MAEHTLKNHHSHEEAGGDSVIVEFTPNDPGNPRNWPKWKKYSVIAPLLLVDLAVSFGASGMNNQNLVQSMLTAPPGFSPASTKFVKDFGVSSEVGTLGLSTYVGGLALGPMVLAPLSEVSQRLDSTKAI